MLATLVVACSCVLVGCHGGNILALAPSNSYSHFTVMEPLFRELAARGHQITVVSSFPQKQPVPNYRDINIGQHLRPVQSNLPFKFVLQMGRNPFVNMLDIWEVGNYMCDIILKTRELQDLYNSSVQYDLVIQHVFTYDCFAVFAERFDTPIVSIVTSSALPWVNSRVGNPDHPAYVVSNFLDANEDMTLYQRTLNSLAWLWAEFAINRFCYARVNNLVHEHLDPTAPPIQEIIKRTSLVLVNSHFSMLQSRPLVPNFIEIGGIHVKEPKPLPEDLQKFLDEAPQGVIVFSLGSLVRASSMSNSSLRALMDTFADLPQRVVFKFEEAVKDAPPNVLVRKWLPQRDLLDHPNVKVLMAHGGQSSTIEAVYTGTPMVGMPLFSDQYSNIRSLVLRGSAELLDVRHLTKERVQKVLKKVLTNSRYKLNAERLSAQFRDRQVSPLQSAVYWTEYVLRHQGAPQLRAKSTNMPLYRFFLLDVAAVLLPILIASYYIAKFLLKYLFYCTFGVFIGTKKSKYD